MYTETQKMYTETQSGELSTFQMLLRLPGAGKFSHTSGVVEITETNAGNISHVYGVVFRYAWWVVKHHTR